MGEFMFVTQLEIVSRDALSRRVMSRLSRVPHRQLTDKFEPPDRAIHRYKVDARFL